MIQEQQIGINMKHAHLLLHCLETVSCFLLSMFMPSVAVALSISEKYVPLFQSLAAIGTICLVAYTFSKEFYKKGWFHKLYAGIVWVGSRILLLLLYPCCVVFRKIICDMTFKQMTKEFFTDFWK